ncbi:MAG: diaminopimelate decarboxylase [Verrucomicrobia bacterium]|nr:diaminopimelate decarboxylase [Verrucomicrobiota bacterium]
MDSFQYRNGQLFAEDVSVADLAEEYGTPLYVYSRTHLIEQYNTLVAAMADVEPVVCFSVKSNTCAAVINTLAGLGSGADVVSGGELFRALRAGIPASKIAFAGVGKTRDEIRYALEEDILFFTVESEPEVERINECAVELGLKGRIAVRVNPDVDPKTHKYTSTGKKENKFGVDLSRARAACERAAALPAVDMVGIHMHLGSPLMDVSPYVEALEKVKDFCLEMKAKHATFRYIDIGGGLGIKYRESDEPFTPAQFADAVLPHLKEMGLQVVMEPGRFIAGNSGILVTRVQYVKDNAFKRFLIVDAAMNDLLRPPLYEAYHEILPVTETSETFFGDVVGPICESGDFMARDRDLPTASEGDLLAVCSAGAYAFAMSSNYNSRPRAAEVMVSGDRHQAVRERESRDDLVRGENIPEW